MIDQALKKIKGRGGGYCPLCVTIALSLHESIRNIHAKDSWLIPKTLFMNMLLWQSLVYLGSVWIKLILLKLKIKNWKYCSKIIFKCVNSVVKLIFNEKVAEKSEIYGYCSWIVAVCPPKTRAAAPKKKKKAPNIENTKCIQMDT